MDLVLVDRGQGGKQDAGKGIRQGGKQSTFHSLLVGRKQTNAGEGQGH